MGKILDYIQQEGRGKYYCYHSNKFSLDNNIHDILSYDDKESSESKKSVFAESNTKRIPTVKIDEHLIKSTTPIFSYFLDGSRHTYKVDDIAIGKKIFPIIAGQIVVGCCERRGRDIFKKCDVRNRIVLSMPTDFDFDDENANNNFCRLYCEKINEQLVSLPYLKEQDIKLDNILLYETDGLGEYAKGKDKYTSRAISKIQNEMTDDEQLLVEELCKQNKLDDENFLLKDGSLEYNPYFSNLEMSKWNILRANYKNVVGVSKSFDPELIGDFEGHTLSKTIANLQGFERTKVYKYKSEHMDSGYFAVWYLRLRNKDYRDTNFSDIIKCEMVLNGDDEVVRTSLVDVISANLIREAYPVCYGSDTRWANHLYPVYLTESFCKSHYISDEIIYKIF